MSTDAKYRWHVGWTNLGNPSYSSFECFEIAESAYLTFYHHLVDVVDELDGRCEHLLERDGDCASCDLYVDALEALNGVCMADVSEGYEVDICETDFDDGDRALPIRYWVTRHSASEFDNHSTCEK